MQFADRNAALRWIITNQFSRRNLPAYERARLALRLKPVLAEQAKKTQGARTDLLQISAKSKPMDTRQDIARAAGVSHDTISKVQTIERAAPEPVKQQLRAGTMSAGNLAVMQIYEEVRCHHAGITKGTATKQVTMPFAEGVKMPVTATISTCIITCISLSWQCHP